MSWGRAMLPSTIKTIGGPVEFRALVIDRGTLVRC
jgi:hypothetical protein